MRFFSCSYIAAGSIGTGSVFFFDLPFGAAGCSWRAELDGGVGAGHVGGGLARRGGAVEVVAVVVVTVPFMAAVCRGICRRDWRGRYGYFGAWFGVLWCRLSHARVFRTRWHGKSDLTLWLLPEIYQKFALSYVDYLTPTL